MPITEGGRFSPVNQIVSPGVFTRENDLSGLAQGVADIGGVVVAPFAKGPGFSPTLITSVTDLEERFGVADGVYYGPYTAKEYLQEQGRVTVCRVGALTGYKQNNPLMIYAVPGAWDRVGLSEAVQTGNNSFVKSSDGSTDPLNFITYSGSNSTNTGSITLNNVTVIAKFNSSSSVFAGQTVELGTTTATFTSGKFFISSSIQSNSALSSLAKLTQALLETTSTTSNLSMSGISLNITASSTFDTEDGSNLTILDGVFKAVRTEGGCGTVLYLVSGNIQGEYGDYTGDFISSSAVSSDPCASSNSGSLPQILAVLANTRNANQNLSDLSIPGFSGNLTTITSSVSERATSLEFDLKLSSSAGSAFGTYRFSLDPNNSKYITSVFGDDPTVGDPAKQVSGQKIEAAYIYSIFEDTIEQVKAKKENWMIKVGTTIEGQNRVGSLLNFSDKYSTDLNKGDSAFGLKQAETPFITSQTVATLDWYGWSGCYR